MCAIEMVQEEGCFKISHPLNFLSYLQYERDTYPQHSDAPKMLPWSVQRSIITTVLQHHDSAIDKSEPFGSCKGLRSRKGMQDLQQSGQQELRVSTLVNIIVYKSEIDSICSDISMRQKYFVKMVQCDRNRSFHVWGSRDFQNETILLSGSHTRCSNAVILVEKPCQSQSLKE